MTLSKDFMIYNCGCYSLKKLMACSFMKNETIKLSDIINSEIPLRDKFWFFCKKIATKEQNRKIAIEVAEIVLPIYEERYQNDLRPHQATEAAKKYISGHITLKQLYQKRDAAADAADAAYAAAAAAAYAAAYAAYAADAAAYAAADSAYAAADSAAYAADVADVAAAAYAYADSAAYAADVALKDQVFEVLKKYASDLNMNV